MSYLPQTEADIELMLDAVGVNKVEHLFSDVPESFRFPELDLPKGKSHLEVARQLERLASQNIAAGQTCTFLGAGSYNHFSPSIVNHVILRGEFLTSYTPYQPEVSQGTLQAIYEYQSMICAITNMEVSNASHYDGATAFAEAIIMAVNVLRNKRSKIVMSSGIHPEYRSVARTYSQGIDLQLTGDDDSQPDAVELINMIDEDTALVAVQYPNFFGQLEDLQTIADAAHAQGALFCVIVTDPTTLGNLKPPGLFGADIVVGEGQSFGIPMSLGGPYLGFFATREKFVRKMPGRLVGETLDVEGQPGYVLTLATREQHIRREKALSNICTNQGLMALAASVYLSAMGKHGVKQVAELCFHRAHYAADEFDKLEGFSVDRSKPFFHEFVVDCPLPVPEINQQLVNKAGIIGGYDLSKAYPDRKNQMLVCVTEMTSRAEIDNLISMLKEEV